MKKNLLTLTLTFAFALTFAQKQTWQWYFGYNASMEFSTGAPTVTNNSAMSQWEGCSSIADEEGNLLFYTDGLSVWNRNHQVMPNGTGLLGDSTSTQSALIVPGPNSDTIYYIFTANGVDAHFSELDISLQGGLGDITANKNILLSSNCAEKLAGIHASDGEDIWVAIHENDSAVFKAFYVSNTGVNLTPVTSTVGNILLTQIGQLCFSPDGKRVAMGSYNSPNNETVDVFDFDNSTGVFSNHIGLVTSYPQTYGLAFSPNGQLLYSGANPNNEIHQWDLSSGVKSIIQASNSIVGTDTNTVGSFQLAPDGKIYVAKESTYYIGVIDNPDLIGAGCSYESHAVNFSPMVVGLGLPNFLASFFPVIKVEHTCFGDSAHFYVLNVHGDSVIWNFGDSASGVANVDTGLSVYHLFTAADTFQITIIQYLASGNADTFYSTVSIYDMPVVTLGNDTMICIGDTLFADAGNAGANYLWSNGSTIQTISITAQGTYSVVVTKGDCPGLDSISVTLFDCSNGVYVLNNYEGVSIYPNPSSGSFMVEWLNGLTVGEVSIDVVNALGQNVFSSHEKISSNNFKKVIDLGAAARGIYFIRIKNETEFAWKRIVVQ